MTAIMRDSIDARTIPADTPIVAGYGDGKFIWSPSWWDGSNGWDLHPSAQQLVIVVDPAHAGDILDVERFDATPADAPGWSDRFRRPGRRRPSLYHSRSSRNDVLTAMAGRPYDWWAATLDGTQDVPGAVAVQYAGSQLTGQLWDESIIIDPSWVGGDVSQLDDILKIVTDTADQVGKLRYVVGPPPGQDGAIGELMVRVRSIDNDAGPVLQAAVDAVRAELDALKAEVEAGGSVDAAAAIARVEQALRGA